MPQSFEVRGEQGTIVQHTRIADSFVGNDNRIRDCVTEKMFSSQENEDEAGKSFEFCINPVRRNQIVALDWHWIKLGMHKTNVKKY